MFVELKTLLHTLLLPPGGLLLLGLAGLWLLRTRARRSGVALIAVALGSLWVLATPRVADALLHAAQPGPPLDPGQPVTAQAIVILGGGSAQHRAPEFANEPSSRGALLERLTYGAYLARRTSLPVLITGTPVETEAMRATLERDFGVPTRWVEARSRDTFENAQFSAQILRPAGITRVLLVTSAAHEKRASAEFSSSGLEVTEAPIHVWIAPEPGFMGLVPSAEALARSTEALYEILGDLARRCFIVLGVRRHTL